MKQSKLYQHRIIETGIHHGTLGGIHTQNSTTQMPRSSPEQNHLACSENFFFFLGTNRREEEKSKKGGKWLLRFLPLFVPEMKQIKAM